MLSDVTNMTKETLATLTNKAVIAVNQDRLGIQARLLPSNSSASGPDHYGDSNASAWAWAVSASTPDTAWSMQADGRLVHPAPTPARYATFIS